MQLSVIIRAQSYEQHLLRTLRSAAAAWRDGSFVKPGDRVLLKPNLLTGARPGKECTTRAELVCCSPDGTPAGGQPFLGIAPLW